MSNLMDLLKQVKERVIVMEGEHPESIPEDAIIAAKRAGVLYRWAKNGGVYQIRWSADHPALSVPKEHVCKLLMEKIVESQQELPIAETSHSTVEEKEVQSPGLSEEDKVIVFDATDSAIELAEEHGIDLATVEGTGKDGRILLKDVQALVE